MARTVCSPLCIPTLFGPTGRQSFATSSTWARDYDGTQDVRPPYCTGTVQCAARARQSSRPNEDARLRMEYAYSSGVLAGSARLLCIYCDLPGSFALHKSDPARLEVCHLRAVARFGSSSQKNLAPGHRACNAAAAERDLLDTLGEQGPWPTLDAAKAWAKTPHRKALPQDLPTVEDMARGRAEKWLADGTRGLGF